MVVSPSSSGGTDINPNTRGTVVGNPNGTATMTNPPTQNPYIWLNITNTSFIPLVPRVYPEIRQVTGSNIEAFLMANIKRNVINTNNNPTGFVDKGIIIAQGVQGNEVPINLVRAGMGLVTGSLVQGPVLAQLWRGIQLE